MITNLQLSIKGTTQRNWLVSYHPNFIGFPPYILNKDLSFTDLSRTFNPYFSTNTTNDSLWPALNQAQPFALEGANGFATASFITQPTSPHMFTLTDNNISNEYLSQSFVSEKGVTAGKRYSWFLDVIAESDDNGDLIAKAVNGVINFNNGPSSWWQTFVRIFYETVDSFYGFCHFGDVGNTFQIYKINKATFNLSALSQNNNTYAFGNGIFRYLGITENGIAVFLYTRMAGISGANTADSSQYSIGYMFLDLSTDVITYSTLHNPNALNTYINLANSASKVTPDLSTSDKNKFYVVGAKNATECQIWRYRISVNTPKTETPTANATLCTLTETPTNFALYCPTKDLLSFNYYHSLDDTRNAEMVPLTVFAENGDEYVAFLGKLLFNYAETKTAFMPDQHSLTVFKVKSDDSATLIFKNQTINNAFGTGQKFNGLIRSIDNKLLFLYNYQGFLPLRWEDNIEGYVIGQFVQINIRRISLLLDNTLIVEASNKNFYCFNVSNSFVLETKFENGQTAFVRNGTPINTNLIINARDMFGNRVKKDVTVSLSNAVFTADSTKVKTIETSELLDTQIPVTMANVGQVSVNASL